MQVNTTNQLRSKTSIDVATLRQDNNSDGVTWDLKTSLESLTPPSTTTAWGSPGVG